ncbi:alpha/beta hydrolase [Pollutibacter soli]|uniref:alpha/beta fold hydrolase n=1 Tax=Pollutibacter soli TaxID=3034157 RepID=UPI003013F1AD
MAVEILQNAGPSGIDIAYERFGDPSYPALLLIMGAGAQMISWPDEFCKMLVNQGFQVIRFDSRDTGLTTHFSDTVIPDFAAVMAGDYTTVSYTLSDMAADTIGLMDGLGIESFHLIGASMGGMIAQTIAIEYPFKILSLTSIMSTTGSNSVGQPDYAILGSLGAPPSDDRQKFIEWKIKSLKAVGSPGFPFDEESAIKNAGIGWDRDHDPLGMTRQAVAVLKSGDRTDQLRKLRLPALVIHGTSDKMIDVSGGIATANSIPGAKLVLFEGMGHSLPQPLWEKMTDLISRLILQSEHVDK